jgi:hypothetical protein
LSTLDFGDEPFGARRRALALLVIAVGMLTFFVPLVTTDPPVVGTSRWSAFAIVMRMYEGKLPEPICERCGEPLIRSLLALPITVSVNYALMVVALVALSFPESPGFLRKVTLVGGLFDLIGVNYSGTKWGFENTFYGRIYTYSVHVHYRWLTDPLLLVMVTLFFISVKKDLDRPPEQRIGA